ncbi:MAG TPA: hypothetical protein VF174_03105 [Micromonosporaceae bacterium]
MPIALAGAAAVLISLIWALRGLLFRLAARRPGRPMAASVLAGEKINDSPVSFG